MKNRINILILVSVILISILFYLQWGTGTPSQLHCLFNKCSIDSGRTVYPIPDPSMPRTSIGMSSESELLLSATQFEETKSNIEKTQYSICDIQQEENKIILHLNWIFEDSLQEEKIISKIPSNVDYQIIYHQGYSDYFINAITAQQCDSLETIKSLKEKYDTVIEGNVAWCMGHKTYPVRYQCDIQVDQYIEFDGKKTGNLIVLSDKYPLISEKQKAFFGLNYVVDENYYELVQTSIVANYNDFIETGRLLENDK